MNNENSGSQKSIFEASEDKLTFSDHRTSGGRRNIGAAGYKDPGAVDASKSDFLVNFGESLSISPAEHGFETIKVGCAWDMSSAPDTSFFGKLFKRNKNIHIDLDLGCLYELKDGTRGALQAFGKLHGNLEQPPYIALSRDEREGDEAGDDEFMRISGKNWNQISRIFIYAYIYKGAPNWEVIKPQIHVTVPHHKPLVVVPSVHRTDLSLCVIAGIENRRDGIVLTNNTEYYPGHAEMDRALGFGLEWEDGEKDKQ